MSPADISYQELVSIVSSFQASPIGTHAGYDNMTVCEEILSLAQTYCIFDGY